MKIGILGYGEIGKSLHEVYKDFKEKNDVNIREIDWSDDFTDLDVLNIAIPFKDVGSFVDVVGKTILESDAKITIIHSTILPGTTDKIRDKVKTPVVHSPVRGIHPNLYEGLKTFVKYVGYETEEEKKLSKKHFKDLEIKTEMIFGSSNTELAKLYSTTYYGLCIAFHGEMKKHFDSEGLNFNIINKWNDTYNQGYKKLGKPNVIRPNLTPPDNNKIGGHCVISNTELLKGIFESDAFNFILNYK
jgi:UDP-N-acetyl-D-mannosaminuronate dehydrogenase